MTERELKKLGRTELLEILLAQSREMDELKKRLAEAEEKLKAREAVMAEADSLAAATAQLYKLIDQAQVLAWQLGGRSPEKNGKTGSEFMVQSEKSAQGKQKRPEEPEAMVEAQLKELEAQLTDTVPYMDRMGKHEEKKETNAGRFSDDRAD